MKDMTSNCKLATRALPKVLLVLLTGIVMIAAMEYPSSVRSFTNPINVNSHASVVNNENTTNTIRANTDCKGEACQSIVCVNNDCRSNSSQVLDPNAPCYLPCLPASPPKSK